MRRGLRKKPTRIDILNPDTGKEMGLAEYRRIIGQRGARYGYLGCSSGHLGKEDGIKGKESSLQGGIIQQDGMFPGVYGIEGKEFGKQGGRGRKRQW